jgi:hypothetical protein
MATSFGHEGRNASGVPAMEAALIDFLNATHPDNLLDRYA